MYMTSSIPDSISAEALEALAENAHADVELPKESMSMEQMQELVMNDIEALTDKFDSMFGYKLVAHYALFKLFHTHNLMHTHACNDNDVESALCIARDAGWIQLMMKGLQDIQCGAQDFMCPIDDD
jgi:hypothetical protein